jgi:hypothetical protein
MRIPAFDYVVATLVAIATGSVALQSGAILSRTLSPPPVTTQTVAFESGERNFGIFAGDACVGTFRTRAKADAVTVLLIDGGLNVSRHGSVASLTAEGKAGFNPFDQLYEASISINLGSLRVMEAGLKSVRPHEISLSFPNSTNSRNLSFSAPGPVMIRPNRNKTNFTVMPPTDLNIPLKTDSISTLLSLGAITVRRNEATAVGAACTPTSSLNLDTIEEKIRSLLPKGLTL